MYADPILFPMEAFGEMVMTDRLSDAAEERLQKRLRKFVDESAGADFNCEIRIVVGAAVPMIHCHPAVNGNRLRSATLHAQ
jgi:hypothetical protein